ncbi:hypothetical protein [Blastococcus sp. CT_GayMR16]|uniref:hypothetical protein n=1 Tax=Blastococcus sp. CT_GayMR16 TaxID=2559607 RepID=UPI001073DA33|nr:hypothetical protein [Blastococcus sp. CT_GayMR16]TFV88575.1 hypothetical protein E4P38_10420 [Blastococcus sp. CT_GayMR16]
MGTSTTGRGMTRALRVITRSAAVALLLSLLAACGGRSVEAYCETFYGEGQELRQQWIDAGNTEDPFAAMGTIFSAPRDLAAFFDRLEKVAPDDIQPDVAQLRDAFQQQADSMGDTAAGMFSNPLGTALGSLAAGMSTSGASQRVDAYTLENCGPPPTN